MAQSLGLTINTVINNGPKELSSIPTATRTLFVILDHSRVEVILLLEQTTLQTVALVWSELAQETNSTVATELILMVGDESFQRNGDPESSLKGAE